MAAADEAAADAERIKRAHGEMVNVHCKLFLAKAFRIDPDGTKITNPSAFLLVGDPPAIIRSSLLRITMRSSMFS